MRAAASASHSRIGVPSAATSESPPAVKHSSASTPEKHSPVVSPTPGGNAQAQIAGAFPATGNPQEYRTVSVVTWPAIVGSINGGAPRSVPLKFVNPFDDGASNPNGL